MPWNEASELLVPVIGFWLSGTLGTGDGRNQRQRPVPCHDVITLGMPGRGWHGGLTKGNKILRSPASLRCWIYITYSQREYAG